MSFALALHFTTDRADGPGLIRTEFRISTDGTDHTRIAVEAQQPSPHGSPRHEFHWNPKTKAVRGFALLCLRHILAMHERRAGFILDKAASQFAGSLAEAARRTETGKNDWLRAIVGVGEFDDADGPRRLFDFPTNCSWIRFEADKWNSAAFHFFIDGEEVSDDSRRLAALADAIEHSRPLPPPPPPAEPLSLRIYSRADRDYLCVVREAALLRERGLLPMPSDVAAQFHVSLRQPRHFCLFAFGPKLAPIPFYPHKLIPGDAPRDGLVLPRDFGGGHEEIPYDGPGGVESLLLLVRDTAPPKDHLKSVGGRLASLLRETGALALADPAEAFHEGGLLVALTKEPILARARPAADPLYRFLDGMKSRFASDFAEFHFLSVHRNDPLAEGRRLKDP